MKKKIKCRYTHYINKAFIVEYCEYYFYPLFWKTLLSKHQFYSREIPELFSKAQAEYFCEITKDSIDIKLFNIDLFLDNFCSIDSNKTIRIGKLLFDNNN